MTGREIATLALGVASLPTGGALLAGESVAALWLWLAQAALSIGVVIGMVAMRKEMSR